jgi:glutamate mutase epsilon subunit
LFQGPNNYMRILPIRNTDDLEEVAQTILDHELADKEKAALIKELIDDPEADRTALVHTAFAMGVLSALKEVADGHFMSIRKG